MVLIDVIGEFTVKMTYQQLESGVMYTYESINIGFDMVYPPRTNIY